MKWNFRCSFSPSLPDTKIFTTPIKITRSAFPAAIVVRNCMLKLKIEHHYRETKTGALDLEKGAHMAKLIDPSTEFGRRVAQRLRDERIIWLTTVSEVNEPHPRPVWFLWDGETFLIFSQAGTHKLEHIRGNPMVSLNLDGDGMGGDIIVFTGEAWADQQAPPKDQWDEYTQKYTEGMKRIGMTAQEFAAGYSVLLRVKPLRLRGH